MSKIDVLAAKVDAFAARVDAFKARADSEDAIAPLEKKLDGLWERQAKIGKGRDKALDSEIAALERKLAEAKKRR